MLVFFLDRRIGGLGVALAPDYITQIMLSY